jgi:hypothetical protein
LWHLADIQEHSPDVRFREKSGHCGQAADAEARRIAANIAKLPELLPTRALGKVKNPKAPAVKREAEEDWGR